MVSSVKESVAQGLTAFVFDLLGNASVWYEQCDGTASLPFKNQGKFHLGGDKPPEVEFINVNSQKISRFSTIAIHKRLFPCSYRFLKSRV
jgi:hypothetical protein